MAAKNVDVVIVGGGFAGLSAALWLKDASDQRVAMGGNPITYVVLESGERLGGRTRSQQPNIDFGGGYVGAAQNYIQYLMRRFLSPPIQTFLPNDKFWLFQDSGGGEAVEFPGNNPLALPGGRNAVERLAELDTLTLKVRDRLDEPWTVDFAKQYDEMSVADYIKDQRTRYQPPKDGEPTVGMSQETAEAFELSIRCAFSVEPNEISMFFMLYYAASAGSYAALVDVAGGDGAAEGSRLMFGTEDIINKLRDYVGVNNIFQAKRVEKIFSDAGASVVIKSGDTWTAKRVIVAMSPANSGDIDYGTAGSTAPGKRRAQLCAAMKGCKGRTIKGFVQFKSAFWREDGPRPANMGFLLSTAKDPNDPKKFPVSWTLDNVWDPEEFGDLTALGLPPVNPPPVYSLMTFIAGEKATYWSKQSLIDRQAAVIEHLRQIYKFDPATDLDPARPYVEENWPSNNTGLPSPGAFMPKNTLSVLGPALREPVGLVHWAGSETAREWVGYMDGAVESGFRAADEVLQYV